MCKYTTLYWDEIMSCFEFSIISKYNIKCGTNLHKDPFARLTWDSNLSEYYWSLVSSQKINFLQFYNKYFNSVHFQKGLWLNPQYVTHIAVKFCHVLND